MRQESTYWAQNSVQLFAEHLNVVLAIDEIVSVWKLAFSKSADSLPK